MACGDRRLAAAFQHRVGGDQPPILEDLDLVGRAVDLDRALPDAIGHAGEVAADRHHALVRDAPLQPQHGAEGYRRQALQARPLVGEGFADDASRGGVPARVGDVAQPAPELVVEVAEGPGKEEVGPDVAERPLDLALALGPVGAAGPGPKAAVACRLEQGAIVGDAAARLLADHRRPHPVVEDLARHAAQRRERGDVTAQQGPQVPVGDATSPQEPAVAQDKSEQPDDPGQPRLVGERYPEPSEIDPGLAPWRGLEAALELERRARSHRPQEPLQDRVAAGIAELANLAQEPHRAELGIGVHPLAQIALECGQQAGP
jgi:hypothetical protein